MEFLQQHKRAVTICGLIVVAIVIAVLVQGYRSFLGTRVPLAPTVSESIIGGRLPATNFSLGNHNLQFRAKTTDGKVIGDTVNFSLAAASAIAHISYFDLLRQDLKYATNASGSWVTTTVDSANAVGDNSDLAVDSQGKIHISYYDRTTQDLKYATNASGAWVITSVDSAGVTGLDTSIAVDSNDKVHISYFDAFANFSNGTQTADLNYATNVSGSWVVTTVDSDGYVGVQTSIAIDGNNKVHISYHDNTATKLDLKYATNASGTWEVIIVDSENGAGSESSIAIDGQNKAHISYVTYTGAATPNTVLLRYATNAGGAWVTSTIDASGSAYYTSLALDSSGAAHISYQDGLSMTKDLRYATNSSGTWVIATVDSAGDVGQYSSLALDSHGKAYISYYDQTNIDLKYAENTSGSWQTATVDSTGSVGPYSSIVISQ